MARLSTNIILLRQPPPSTPVTVFHLHLPSTAASHHSSSLPKPSTCRKGASFLNSRGAKTKRRRNLSAAMALSESEVMHDVYMSGISTCVALALLRFWEFSARMGVEQKLNRKLVHISIGLVFMLFWPLFSYGIQAPFLASLAPGVNIFRMLLIGLGIQKNEDVVRSMTREGHYRELLKGPLYYACTLTLATILYWRTSPIGIAAICNLCAGDGFADIVGRRFGRQKLPYNLNKSYMGSFAMAAAGFFASVFYMHYFSLFGFIEESWGLVLGCLLVSMATAVVESLPISSVLDDNLTIP